MLLFYQMDKIIYELAEQLGKKLLEKGMVMSTAESCTGGGIAQAITEIPGSSGWFDRGFVSYSNRAKVQMLQVNPVNLKKFGAVSQEIALEMVEGALLNSDADIAVSVTGIAGPDGGTEKKPVGTVYIAWKARNKPAYCEMPGFFGDRAKIRGETIKYALSSIFKQLNEG